MKESLAIYLRDHLAGSVVAVELLHDLIEAATTEEARGFYNQLLGDIETDQKVLKSIIAKAETNEGTVRKAAGWVAEKAGGLKLKASGLAEGQLGCFQALEGILLGITGKKSLWKALESKAGELPCLEDIDFPGLIRSAEKQIQRVEKRRLEQATVALY